MIIIFPCNFSVDNKEIVGCKNPIILQPFLKPIHQSFAKRGKSLDAVRLQEKVLQTQFLEEDLMKTIFKFLALAMLLATFSAGTVTKTYAQDPQADKAALYKTYTDNYAAKEVEKKQLALDAAKSYVEKYGANPEDKDQVDYFKKAIPSLEKNIADQNAAAAKAVLAAAQGKILARFDNAAKTKNIPEIFAGGKEIVSKEADFPDISLDILLTMTAAGFDQATATPPVDTYNADTIDYAKNAIQKIESGKTSTNWGVWSYNFKLDPKDTKFKDNKAYTLGVLNYIVGNVTYYRLGKDNAAKKKEALPYFYKATQYDSLSKTNPQVYQAIGAWYLEEAIRIDKERAAKLAANGNKDNDETLAMVGEQKGYADRAIDAYSRAFKLAKAAPKPDKTYSDGLYSRLTDLYKFRFDNKTDGIDAYIATVDSKPFPDPTTAITPVKVEPADPTTTTTTSSTTDTTKPATTPAVKPATTTTPKPATTPTTGATKPSGTSNVDATTTDDKTAVKKTTPKKKGTR